ncbi:MAG: YihY/virulence factor BrkB family protein [Verrucomicrobiota bacterium]
MSLKSLWTALRSGTICVGKILWRTITKYNNTDGELRAASFGYYAFFALFPLLLLLIYLGTMIMGNKDIVASQVLGFVNTYIPVGPHQQNVVQDTVSGVLKTRVQSGALALLALGWSSLRFFQALVHGVNRAWGTREYAWWHLPLANLGMVAILSSTLLLGVVAPVVMQGIEAYWAGHEMVGREVLQYSFRITRLTLPWMVLFYGLVMFYKYAPRRKTLFREVWVAALLVTLLLQLLIKGFVFYATHFAKFNALYGTLGNVVGVLMWIYLSGSVIIFGGCLCAAQSEILAEDKEEVSPEI